MANGRATSCTKNRIKYADRSWASHDALNTGNPWYMTLSIMYQVIEVPNRLKAVAQAPRIYLSTYPQIQGVPISFLIKFHRCFYKYKWENRRKRDSISKFVIRVNTMLTNLLLVPFCFNLNNFCLPRFLFKVVLD